MKAPLFEAQATGGVVARGGFEYQDAYLQQHFPHYFVRKMTYRQQYLYFHVFHQF